MSRGAAISAALGGAACSGATYSISGGNDAALFAIGADTGLLTFATAPASSAEITFRFLPLV